MRTRSVVAIVSTAMLMACQTSAPSSVMNRQAPAPVLSAQGYQTAPASQNVPAFTGSKAADPVAAEGSRKKTWIIVALVAAVAVVAVVLASGGSDGGGTY